MYLAGLLVIAPFWGFVSPWLFFRSWLNFLGLMATVFCLVRGKRCRKGMAKLFFSHLTETVCFFMVLLAGFLLFYRHWSFGNNDSETLIFWIFSTIQLAILIPSISRRVDVIIDRIRQTPTK